MNNECEKCSYKTGKIIKKFEKNLCEFCLHFSPDEEDKFLIYMEEKVNWREIQTYRKQGKLGGVRQKRGMKNKARGGQVVSRPAFGYAMIENKLVPAQNSHIIREIYEEFLDSQISLNRLSKKHGLSVNGLKKILSNFTYIGRVKFDGELHEGEHMSLVDPTLFNHVQDKLAILKIKI